MFDALWKRLASNNSLVRIGVVLLLDVLFERSRLVRELTVLALAELLSMTIGSTRGNRTLPPPPLAAGRLRQLALGALERWSTQFGPLYPQLVLCFPILYYYYYYYYYY